MKSFSEAELSNVQSIFPIMLCQNLYYNKACYDGVLVCCVERANVLTFEINGIKISALNWIHLSSLIIACFAV